MAAAPVRRAEHHSGGKNVRLGSAAYRGRPAKDTSRRAEDEMDDPGGSTLGKIGGLLAPDDLYLAYFAQRNRA